MPVRPTLRCLREDLHLPLPPASTPLDQVDHPLLTKAGEQFADPDTPHERIRAVDDVVLFKVKTGRWRGATYIDQATAEARGHSTVVTRATGADLPRCRLGATVQLARSRPVRGRSTCARLAVQSRPWRDEEGDQLLVRGQRAVLPEQPRQARLG